MSLFKGYHFEVRIPRKEQKETNEKDIIYTSIYFSCKEHENMRKLNEER
jgi:hypothetical protein